MRLVLVALAAVFLLVGEVRAHDIYTQWRMPDSGTSCCSNHDCYATDAEFKGGTWFAKRREDGRWLVVPSNKILKNQHTDDGKAHLCAPPPSPADIVYCFKPPEFGS
jgi:hypothetical protein